MELDRCIEETKDYDENGEFLSCVLYKDGTWQARFQRAEEVRRRRLSITLED